MKIIRVFLPVLILSGCAPTPDQSIETEGTACLLEQHKLPGQELSADNNFDAEDNLANLSAEVPAEVMAAEIRGYRSHVAIGSGKQPQFLYLTFSTPYEAIQFDDAEGQPIPEHDNLFRIPGESQHHWDLAEKERGNLVLWGACSDNFQGSFDCMAHLPYKQIAINFEVHQANLHLYKEIEGFIQNQVAVCHPDL